MDLIKPLQVGCGNNAKRNVRNSTGSRSLSYNPFSPTLNIRNAFFVSTTSFAEHSAKHRSTFGTSSAARNTLRLKPKVDFE